jgi:hypothetical protein
MLGNIWDRRTDPHLPAVDAVFEPSAHDNAKRPDGSEYFPYEDATDDPTYFIVLDQLDTTVRDACLRAETDWPFPVTVYLYDAGSRPLG